MVDSLHTENEKVSKSEATEATEATATLAIAFGQLLIGNTLEVGTSTKNGITSKANYYRLSNKQDLPLIGSKLITSSKDKVEFAVNVREIQDEKLLEFINTNKDNGTKVLDYIKDCIYSTYKEMANAAYNCQAKVIKLELIDCVEFATMARSRTRKAISFTGEYFKQSQEQLMKAFIIYAEEDRGIEVSSQVAIKTMASLKVLLTIEQMIPTEKQIDTLAGIFSYVEDVELSNNLGAVIELKNELYNNVGDLENFV